MRSDNVKLFEKIKYLESYGSKELEGDEPTLENKYASLYEETVNPFTAFNRKVCSKKDIPEKIIFFFIFIFRKNTNDTKT